ncbi:uncharacterized protein LOC120215420 [Hibiscus syriacus]|uniref:uncharacterized protein LOC120215420 n=1 Tax=Hibiscus syriacus TaxID=106335 RepID=UPI001921EA48|nr:uncharacterized protein LOC120215420 [Hibiscus syriacus]
MSSAVGSNKEWKPKVISSNFGKGSGIAGASDVPTSSVEANAHSQPVLRVLDSEEATSKLQKKLEELHLRSYNMVVVEASEHQQHIFNGILTEEVYMTQPPSYEQGDVNLVCKLNKAIYDLKQAPHAWFERLRAYSVSEKFLLEKSDSSLFVRKTANNILYLLVYVDDIILTGSSEIKVQTIIDKLNKQFALKDLGVLSFFLGIEVCHDSIGITLTQQKYVRELLQMSGLEDAKGIHTPMVTNRKLSVKECILLLVLYIFWGNLISWSSHKQQVVARSTAEAEYRSVVCATVELHVELDLFFVREMVIASKLQVQEVPTFEQVADVMTKPLSAPLFLIHRHKLQLTRLKCRDVQFLGSQSMENVED